MEICLQIGEKYFFTDRNIFYQVCEDKMVTEIYLL